MVSKKLAEGVSVVIPSKGRAERIEGSQYFAYAHYVVCEAERDEYAAVVGANRLIVCPNTAEGNIARKRNWIINNIPRPLLMIDDDVKCIRHAERGAQQIRLNANAARAVIIQGFNLAHDWKVPLWGINVNIDGRNYQQYKPFSLTQMVLGPFVAHMEHGLQYDERMDTKDDYDISLQALAKYKKILRINKYSYDCGHGTNEGGIVAYRTWEREGRACAAIMRKWGSRVIKYKTGKSAKKYGDVLNGRVHVPIAGV